jgi:hypothetical protein
MGSGEATDGTGAMPIDLAEGLECCENRSGNVMSSGSKPGSQVDGSDNIEAIGVILQINENGKHAALTGKRVPRQG